MPQGGRVTAKPLSLAEVLVLSGIIYLMKRYNPSEIEPKWQKIWSDNKTYQAPDKSDKPKAYIAAMFPYPSGAGLHTGHARNYSIVDAIARFYRQRGRNVLNPIGWDTFGLPAENYAIKTGTAPAEITAKNIETFKNQLNRLGMSFDWSREINTSDPDYYKWTQWIFTQLYKRGLAYQKESYQWWDPIDKTVLANEQVIGGFSERSGAKVEKRLMKQWFFKITAYADDLLDGLDDLDWPEHIKAAQRNWIGRSVGANIDFKIDGALNEKSDTNIIEVFSTRPDTLFGATFVVLAPEHPLVTAVTTKSQKELVQNYVEASAAKSDVERMESKEKTGVFTGSFAINPLNGNKVPIWVADYVLPGYGTGAVMSVPAHDERDNEFAKKFDLPIIQVIEKPENNSETELYTGEGILVNSDAYNGTRSEDAREQIVSWLEQQGVGHAETTYKLRDWLISRQRYWGAPIPIAYDKEGNAHAISEKDLPVVLPRVGDYKPDGSGKGVLARNKDFAKVTINGEEMTRETDTMDGFACSSWYLLRYTDPKNIDKAWDPEKANYWAPVDFYSGGDHVVGHLLYVRFWTRVFYDLGLIDFKEPIKKLVYNGYINAADGTKMSKSKGNTVDPLELIDAGYGADALRVYELFVAPYELDASFDPHGLVGTHRFLNRIFTLVQEYLENSSDKTSKNNKSQSEIGKNSEKIKRIQHKTIKKVTEDMNHLSFNTAISALMEYVNELYKFKVDGFSEEVWGDALADLVRMVAPFAPHVAAELWEQLGNSVILEEAGWPTFDKSHLVQDEVKIMVQVNGKIRGDFMIPVGLSQEEVLEIALKLENVAKYTLGKEPKKVIYIPNKILNIVV